MLHRRSWFSLAREGSAEAGREDVMQKEGQRKFDAAAEHWDEEPRRLKLAQDVVAAICRELPITAKTQALDYGCGSGLVTLGLQPFVGRITGADSSQGMLEVLKRKLRANAVGNVDLMAIDPEQELQLGGLYDLIVSSMTMHHVPDVAALIASLAKALNPGGWLALADLETEDGGFHQDQAGVHHHGFDREFIPLLYANNLLTEIRVVSAAAIEKPDPSGRRRIYPVLLWLGRKGSD
jgi:2-polyprenyl-3-methyl-5-hydroxy-6-metoxy-1,4-benzoquinol methylase